MVAGTFKYMGFIEGILYLKLYSASSVPNPPMNSIIVTILM